MMNKDIKQKWIDALRSGEYKQGTGQLRSLPDENNVCSFCCLGVLCEVIGLAYQEDKTNCSYFFPLNDDYVRVALLKKSLGEHCESLGFSVNEQAHLINLNDGNRESFTTIANYIEEYL